MTRRPPFAAAFVTAGLLFAACGGGGHEGMNMNGTTTAPKAGSQGLTAATNAAPTRAVDMDMVDIAFQPKELAVKKGETVRFVFHNRGKVKHEAFFGDTEAQNMHEQAMNPSGASAHMEDMNEVAPGATTTVDYTFDHSIIIGCHEAGHYAAGMKIDVTAK
jgi:uncharacterized cupredoxin-like copper-binding protein